MPRSRKANREIKRNITGYLEVRRDIDFPSTMAAVLLHIGTFVMAFAIPLFCVLVAMNVIFRVPDLYNFELGRSEILREISLGVESSQIGDEISNYMLHKTEDLSLKGEVRGREVEVFPIVEAARVSEYRSLLDMSVYVIGFGGVLAIVMILLLVATKRKKLLRRGFHGAIAVYLGVAAAGLAFSLSEAFRKYALEFIDAAPAWDLGGGRLDVLFGTVYRLEAFGCCLILSAILFAIIYSIGRRLYRQDRKMFMRS